MANQSVDLFVIGGGSGGIACARRAAAYGAKVAIAETGKWGGTCVNVGCVPKKIMWWCSTVNEILGECHQYGFSNPGKETQGFRFCWETIKARRDASISRLNEIYIKNLSSSGIKHIHGYASFVEDNAHKIKVNDDVYEAKHVLLATGGKPKPIGIPGEEHAITSDTFFELNHQPKKVAVIGAGYIAVELAGVFNGLGTETHLFIRGETALRRFEEMLAVSLHQEMIHAGVKIHPNTAPEAIHKDADSGKLSFIHSGGKTHSEFDEILIAVGRQPRIDSLNLPLVGIKQKAGSGYVVVNHLQETDAAGVYALGDLCGLVELTPMAIAAGRRLADRLFGGIDNAMADYTGVPSVIFSHPPIGTIGLSEKEAKAKYGDDKIKVYNSTAINLYYNVFDVSIDEKPKTRMKLICLIPDDERIVGFHVIGMAADEMMQGFGVAIKMGARKADFDKCVAIHPTAAEEAVTMAPWGLKEEPKKPKL